MQETPETLEQYFERMARFNQQLRDKAAVAHFKMAQGPRRERRARAALGRGNGGRHAENSAAGDSK